MKVFYRNIFLLSSCIVFSFAGVKEREIRMELKQLEQLKNIIEKKIEQNRKILQTIETKKRELKQLKQKIDKQIQEIQNKRFKKLAKDFENMDPEYAGAKLSKIENPKIAAYILYNMNPRKAGEALNYVEAKALNKITKILTQLKNNDKK